MKNGDFELKIGAPGGTRTHDPLLRRQMLYPAELPELKRQDHAGNVNAAWRCRLPLAMHGRIAVHDAWRRRPFVLS